MAINRRQFVHTTLGAAAALGAVRSGWAAPTGVKDIRIGQIGFNGQGSGHIERTLNNIAALCDVDSHVLKNKADWFKAEHKKDVLTFTDYRELIESDKIDVVSIATPNHTHALIAIAAMKAGKDVYVEKPISHNVWEGRQVVAAARKYDKIVQCGTQSRSSQALMDAEAFLRTGQLGAIRYAYGTCYKPRPSIGKSAEAFKFPSHIDRELWLGPAADEPFYRPEKNSQGQGKINPHYDWHWDFNTGCGDLGNQGIHQMDIARRFLGEQALAPRTFSVGGRLGYDDAGDTANTQLIYHDYAKVPLIFEVRGLPRNKKQLDKGRWEEGQMDRFRGSRIGVLVQCEKGYLLIPSYNDAEAFDERGRTIKKWADPPETNDHHKNWLQAVAAHDKSLLNAEIQQGHLSSALCHTANVSYRLGEAKPTREIADQLAGNELLATAFDRMCGHLRANGVEIDDVQDGESPPLRMGPWLEVDPDSETFAGNVAATKLRTREYRAPFAVPDVESDTATQSAAAG